MQRTPRKPAPKVSTAMRRSMLQLEKKARWIRRTSEPLPPDAAQQDAEGAAKGRGDVDRLDEIEAGLADWLNSA